MKKVFRKARIVALKICYQLDVCNSFNEEFAIEVLRQHKDELDEQVYKRAETLVLGVIKELSFLDKLLRKFSQNWDVSRMSFIDRNILRIALYEMLFLDEIPDIVAIDEAIEISKIYSCNDSGKFINGILDSIRREVILQKEQEK